MRILTPSPLKMAADPAGISARTIHVYKERRARSLESWQSCFVQRSCLGSWVELGKRLFDAVLKDVHLPARRRQLYSKRCATETSAASSPGRWALRGSGIHSWLKTSTGGFEFALARFSS